MQEWLMTTQKNLNSCVRQAPPDSKCICAWLPSCLNDYENFLFLAFGRGERKRKNKKRDRESKIEMLWDWECKHQANAFAKKTNCVMKEATMKVWEKKKTNRERVLTESSTSALCRRSDCGRYTGLSHLSILNLENHKTRSVLSYFH